MGLYTSKVSPKVLMPTCHSLASTYHAGIPIVRGLEIASEQARSKDLKKVLAKMASDIKDRGMTLEQAAHAHQKHLPEFFSQLLSAGEAGGQLDIMLRDLAAYYEERLRLKRQFIGEMILPILYLIAAWFLGTFAIGIMRGLPALFTGGASNSGAPTDGIAYIEYFIKHIYIPLQIKAGIVAAIAFVSSIVLSRLGVLGYITGFVSNFIWPFKPLTRRLALARFFKSFALLTGAGVRIKDCLLGAAATTANPYIKKDLEQALPPIMDGATLVQAFSHCKTLTPTAREMIFVGEQGGNIDTALMKVAQYHQEEATHAMKVLNTVFFVLVILFVAAVIGAIVIYFWSTYFGLLNSI